MSNVTTESERLPESRATAIKKRTASKKQKTNGIKLWNSIKDEVCLTDEFNLSEELKCKADKYLHALKIKVWRISLAKGSKDDAMKIVFGYNKAVNDLLANVIEPKREDFIENIPVPVAGGGAIDESVPVFTLIECPPAEQEDQE